MPEPVKHRGKRRKSIHFEFGSHMNHVPVKELPPWVKTAIFENVSGEPHGFVFREQDLENSPTRIRQLSVRNQSWLNIVRSALRKRMRATIGEQFLPEEKKKYELLRDKFRYCRMDAFVHPTIENIQQYFIVDASLQKMRHEMIHRVIKGLKKTDLDALVTYGEGHSLLSQELQQQGVKTSREIHPLVFDDASQLTRTLIRGIPPEKIRPIEWKRAYFCEFLYNRAFEYILEKPHKRWTEHDLRFASLVITTLLKRLPERTLDELLAGKITPLFTENGLHFPPRKGEIEAFLEKHSTFYQRQKALEEFRKKNAE